MPVIAPKKFFKFFALLYDLFAYSRMSLICCISAHDSRLNQLVVLVYSFKLVAVNRTNRWQGLGHKKGVPMSTPPSTSLHKSGFNYLATAIAGLAFLVCFFTSGFLAFASSCFCRAIFSVSLRARSTFIAPAY